MGGVTECCRALMALEKVLGESVAECAHKSGYYRDSSGVEHDDEIT